MNIFKKNKMLPIKEPEQEELVISVPDIKTYLVKEYDRVNDLKLKYEALEQELEESKEIKFKYDAALVTLDEYSKRLEQAEREINRKNDRILELNRDLRANLDTVNSYKIKLTNAALEKAEIENEIIEETKEGILSLVYDLKGNLSKKSVCEVIESYRKEV